MGLLVLAAFLTLADRWAVLYAEHRAADALKDRLKLTAAPEVEIDGFPFLPQFVDGRLDSVKVTVPDVSADRITLASVSATARDITLDGDGPTSVRGARVPELNGDVLLSFADLNRELGASQVTFTGRAGTGSWRAARCRSPDTICGCGPTYASGGQATRASPRRSAVCAWTWGTWRRTGPVPGPRRGCI